MSKETKRPETFYKVTARGNMQELVNLQFNYSPDLPASR